MGRYFNQASLLHVSDTGYSTLRLDSVTKTCKNELSHSCASQISSPVDDGNPAGMQVRAENNCVEKTGISNGGYIDAIKRKITKTKLETFLMLGSKRRGAL